jgi:hypothetical protein
MQSSSLGAFYRGVHYEWRSNYSQFGNRRNIMLTNREELINWLNRGKKAKY